MSMTKKFLSMLFALTLLSLVACGGGQEAYEEEETASGTQAASAEGQAAAAPAAVPADAGTITGVVKFEGTPPPMPTLAMGADPVCQGAHDQPVHAQEVEVGPDGGVADVLVYLKPEDVKGTYPPPSTPEILNQQGCQYHPHVGAVMVGQTLEIKNDDSTLHNVHAMAKNNSEFNVGQPVQGMVSKKTFDKVEVPIKFKCDVHGWMSAYLAVLPHPFYAVSSADGTFTIKGVPPGTYTLIFWQEKYGPKEQQVTVAPNGTAEVSQSYSAS